MHLLPVAARGRQSAAGAHHRFGDERRAGVRALAQDQRLQCIGHAGRELFLGFAVVMEAVVVRILRVQEPRERQAEIRVHVRLAGCADRG